MNLPPGMFSSLSTQVLSLDGLKQALWDWFEKFRSIILDFTFTQSQYDSSLISFNFHWDGYTSCICR